MRACANVRSMCVRACVCVCLSGGHQYCQWPGEGEGGDE